MSAPEGGGVSIDGISEALRAYTALTITFPRDMVSPDSIDAPGVESPLVFWPPVNGEFTWSTPTQGTFLVKGPLIPGQTYRLRLREGLRDVLGAELPSDAWGAEMSTPPLKVEEDSYDAPSLSARPQFRLEFNYPIRLSDAAEGIWFQNRATRERFPAEIFLNTPGGEMEGAITEGSLGESEEIDIVRVRPRDPLPVGAFYDLVVENVADAYAGRTLPYPRVFPLGTTRPLRIEYAVARNEPFQKPRVEVKFAAYLGSAPLPADALTITPPVASARIFKEGEFLVAEGDFEIGARYRVTISDKVLGWRGYGLPKPETWGVTFKPRRPAIYFPDRALRERSAGGFHFAFHQIATGPLEWKLAPVPLDRLAEATKRLREFDDLGKGWTEEGLLARKPTELLIPALGLEPLAGGTIPGVESDKETLREISWKPETGSLAGPLLIEVAGRDAQGRLIGNRALVFFGEDVITRKVGPSDTTLRVARMGTGAPVPGITVGALDQNLTLLESGTTDANGIVRFANGKIPGVEYFSAGDGDSLTLQPARMSNLFPEGWAYRSSQQPHPLRSVTFTDRPLYRPGQKVSFKGMARVARDGALRVPSGTPVRWTIQHAIQGPVASGQTIVDAAGGWNGSWTPPENGPLGTFFIQATVDDMPERNPATFQIEEYRNPAYSVLCEPSSPAHAAESAIRVSSQYFHGAPNAGASLSWTATWTDASDEDFDETDETDEGEPFIWVDRHSENCRAPSYQAEISGEAILDEHGQAVLRCEPPFKDPGNRARCRVFWKVDITGPDGQTLTGGAEQDVAMLPALLGVASVDTETPGQLAFEWDAQEFFGRAPESVTAELFHVATKSAKERIAPNVYRYRNFDQFSLIEKRENVTERELAFAPGRPGRYVLVLTPKDSAMPVSAQAYLSGDEASENPIASDASLTVLPARDGLMPDKPWKVGETARLPVLAPAPGIAWVSVETDRILDTFTVPLRGNAGEIEIPIKPEYEPNAFVTVYLLRPGGETGLAGEMFGYTEIPVIAEGRDLDMSVNVERKEYEPRQKVSGAIRVTAAGKPVPGADVAIAVVDDSILALGGWTLPSFVGEFFPQRGWEVTTYTALTHYIERIAPSWLTAKGFVIGDGGEETLGSLAFVRKDFKPILLWQPSVTTDAEGMARFSCETPDNLTRFRVIAIGQTQRSQFGAGDATFEVSKRLLIEPALPRFAREGDEITLRAVLRQRASREERLVARCSVEGGMELLSEARQEITAVRDAPVVVRFRARATRTGPATVRFEVSSPAQPGLADVVETALPIAEPVLPRKETIAGSLEGPDFRADRVIPDHWKDASGSFSLAVSTTPWLAKLMGLPFLLEYPHGCFEQQTSRLLACVHLGDLLEGLPDAAAQRDNYARVIGDTLGQIESSLLPGGLVPYWPRATTPSDYVTIQAAWCVAAAEAGGFEVPERLAEELPRVMQKMAANALRPDFSPTLRAFALFVSSLFDGADTETLVAAANDLYLTRDKLTSEGQALLAIALHNMEAEPGKQKQLVADLPERVGDIAFNPRTFSSAVRTQALCLWARLLMGDGAGASALRSRLEELMESSSSLSTQENLWLLIAFDSLLKQSRFPALRETALAPRPKIISTNRTAAAWTGRSLAQGAEFSIRGLPRLSPPGSFVLTAHYRKPETKTPLEAQGMRIERVVKNLTDPSRAGTPEAPMKLGDQILISYRFSSDKPQDFVAIEDLLPAGLDVVNPQLALFGKFYALPDPGAPEANLSYSELRDQQANLYFDHLPAGATSYAILARATAAGSFVWPAAGMQPMYDARFFARSPSSSCVVAE